MVVVILSYWIYSLYTYGIAARYWILALLLLPGIIVPVIVLREIRKEPIRKWIAGVFLFESLFTLWMGFLFFEDPMHDIALDFFGHHGRFATGSLNSSAFLLDGITLPAILFLPPLVIGIIFFVRIFVSLQRLKSHP
jgi:hypothetical protein